MYFLLFLCSYFDIVDLYNLHWNEHGDGKHRNISIIFIGGCHCTVKGRENGDKTMV